MKQKAVTVSLPLAFMIVVLLVAGCGMTTSDPDPLLPGEKTVSGNPGATVWTEVPITDGMMTASGVRMPFNLRSIITGDTGDGYVLNTYVFSGTVIDRKEYEVSWTDENGEQWGPFPRSIIEVRVTKEYHGESPVKGDIIRVLYTQSLSETFSDSIRIMDNSEYVFVNCWRLDDKYFAYDAQINPNHGKDVSLSKADVIMGGTWNSVFAFDNGKVILYHGYVSYDARAMEEVLPSDSVMTDKLTSPDSLKFGDFVALDAKDLESVITALFENPEKLPTVEK